MEKAFKALLVQASGELPPRVHDLVRLAELVRMPEELFPELDELSRVYVLTRYPDAIPADIKGYGIEQVRADKHEEVATGALQWVKDKLSTGS